MLKINEAREKRIKDEASNIAHAREQGIEKGIEQGSRKGAFEKALETAAVLKKAGVRVDLIIESTGLTKRDINLKVLIILIILRI